MDLVSRLFIVLLRITPLASLPHEEYRNTAVNVDAYGQVHVVRREDHPGLHQQHEAQSLPSRTIRSQQPDRDDVVTIHHHSVEIAKPNPAPHVSPKLASKTHQVSLSARRATSASPFDPQDIALDASVCNASMVGTWWLHNHSLGAREFRIFRTREGALVFKQAAHNYYGFRDGWLQEHRSSTIGESCCFEATLSDHSVLLFHFHGASALDPESLEIVATSTDHLTSPLGPVLAIRPPPPTLSSDECAWILSVVILLSGPFAATVWKHCVDNYPPTPADADFTLRQQADQGESNREEQSKLSDGKEKESRQHEDWIDVMRLACILLMAIRHIVQSLERLNRIDPGDLSFFLHGLPLFMYLSGRSFGISVSETTVASEDSLKARLFDHIAFVKHRAAQLLVPSVLGVIFIVIPTEYVGRHWRTCAAGPDAPVSWLKAYILGSKGGLRCEGFGWLGFMVSLFFMQAMVRPWALALHKRASAAQDPPSTADICWVAVWLSAGISLASLGLPGHSPLGVRGFLRPDTCLALSLPLADLLSVVVTCPFITWVKGQAEVVLGCFGYNRTISIQFSDSATRLSSSMAQPASETAKPFKPATPPASSLRLAGLVRRVVASVALATWTKHIPYVAGDAEGDVAYLWIEVCLLMIFYQQGIADGIFRGITKLNEPSLRNILPKQLSRSLCGAVHSCESFEATGSVCWGRFAFYFLSILFVILLPIPASLHSIVMPGYRYPAFYRASAGHFVLRSWIILGLGVWWWGRHLPSVLMGFKIFASVGFTFYLLHWFFVELVLGQIYRHPVEDVQHLGQDDIPWWIAFIIALFASFVATSLCHAVFLRLTGKSVKFQQSLAQFLASLRVEEDIAPPSDSLQKAKLHPRNFRANYTPEKSDQEAD